jgi:hypothetical protein
MTRSWRTIAVKCTKVCSSPLCELSINLTCLLFPAKIVNLQQMGSTTKYFIHYQQWARRFDVWVEEEKLARINDEKRIAVILNGPVKAETKGTRKSGRLYIYFLCRIA